MFIVLRSLVFHQLTRLPGMFKPTQQTLNIPCFIHTWCWGSKALQTFAYSINQQSANIWSPALQGQSQKCKSEWPVFSLRNFRTRTCGCLNLTKKNVRPLFWTMKNSISQISSSGIYFFIRNPYRLTFVAPHALLKFQLNLKPCLFTHVIFFPSSSFLQISTNIVQKLF